MKKTIIFLTMTAALGGVGVAHAALLQAGSTGTITVTSGCFTYGTCVVGGLGNLTDNARLASTNGIGSAIAGDGIIGKMNFTVGADGNSINITSYNMDTYQNTAMGDYNTRIVDTSGANGVISDAGGMTLNLAGRTAIGQFTYAALGEQAWNLDTHVAVPGGLTNTFCIPGTGAYTPFTTGSSTALDCATGATAVSLAGSVLSGSVVGGVYTGTGTIVSAGNVGSAWGYFDGTPYGEIYNITVTGTSAVPVPAAVWLLGSGLMGLVGMARRKKS